MFEKIITKYFPNFVNVNYISKELLNLSNINKKKTIPGHITDKLKNKQSLESSTFYDISHIEEQQHK